MAELHTVIAKKLRSIFGFNKIKLCIKPKIFDQDNHDYVFLEIQNWCIENLRTNQYKWSFENQDPKCKTRILTPTNIVFYNVDKEDVIILKLKYGL